MDRDTLLPRVFCLSIQRSGTSSVGKFLRDFGYQWAGWDSDEKNGWSQAWYRGDWEAIFSSVDFRAANGFEDSPWFFPDFYKVLFHRFPDSKFILFRRDPERWFQSMLSHSGENVIGWSSIHCKIYRREQDYLRLAERSDFDPLREESIHGPKSLKLTGMKDHYTTLYQLHYEEVVRFFARFCPSALFVGALEDSAKWEKLGNFLGVNVPPDYNAHENATILSNPTPVRERDGFTE